MISRHGCRFNGAAVRKRRRAIASDWPKTRMARFNGAAVRKRRRVSESGSLPEKEEKASMGPPFENGGGCHSTSSKCTDNRASMGPPFENGGGAR